MRNEFAAHSSFFHHTKGGDIMILLVSINASWVTTPEELKEQYNGRAVIANGIIDRIIHND